VAPGTCGCGSPEIPGCGNPACSDGLDNDGDGKTDYAPPSGDPGCASATDTSEKGTKACDDGRDNDGDGWTDFQVGVGRDPGCAGPATNNENPACQDGNDNDGDGKRDFDGGASRGVNPPTQRDPQCTTASTTSEQSAAAACGIGFELVALAPLLAWLARRRRSEGDARHA
jgi:hypothetical protein